MQITKERTLSSRLYGFWRLSHPGPVSFHLLAVTLFALLAAWPHPVWPTLCLVIGAHLAMQLAIAMLNDYCDRRLDTVGKPSKPIPSGLVTPREALLAGCLMIALMLLLLLPLPPLAWLLSLLYLGLGMAYNLGLKSTPFSGIVFALAMPLVPLYAFAGFGRDVPFLVWLVPLGFLLGVALNLANSLPDLEEDAAHGANTLAVVLGVKRTFFTCNMLVLLSGLLIILLDVTHIVVLQMFVFIGTMILTGLLLILLLFSKARDVGVARKTYFYLVVLACLVLAAGWFLGALLR